MRPIIRSLEVIILITQQKIYTLSNWKCASNNANLFVLMNIDFSADDRAIMNSENSNLIPFHRVYALRKIQKIIWFDSKLNLSLKWESYTKHNIDNNVWIKQTGIKHEYQDNNCERDTRILSPGGGGLLPIF